jgi:EAL domain-containing protein (putative c-di-GMP-specific phosphodiesterase class I)
VSAAIETSRAVAAVLSRDQDGPGGCGDEAAIAEFIANVLHPGLAADRAARQRVESVLHDRAFDIVVQPIYDLTTGSMTSVEALSRFRTVPYVAPDVWFAEAQKAGLGPELELAALDAALETLDELPAGIRLALNASPQIIASEHLIALVDRCGPGRVVVELTEHLRVEDYPALTRRLEPLRREGAMLAVDDTGAGISSLTHILKLAPDIIKLDRYLTSGVDIDPVRRALAAALITFAAESGTRIVAEGIETADELATLCALGVHYGQGYYLGRPGPARHLDLGPDAARRIAEGRAAASSRPGS